LPNARSSRTAERNALAEETLPLRMSAGNEEGDSLDSREVLLFQHAHIYAAEVGGTDLSDLLHQLGCVLCHQRGELGLETPPDTEVPTVVIESLSGLGGIANV
jgi:hypothetical protein